MFITREEALNLPDRRYRGYASYDIKPTKEQLAWLLCSLDILKNGQWPANMKDDLPSARGGSHKAYWETPILMWIELEERLRRVGADGIACRDYYGGKKNIYELSMFLHCDTERVERIINRALGYMAGFKRKRQTYAEWLAHPWYERRKKLQ